MRDNKIWFSALSTLNDPFEACTVIDYDSVLKCALEQEPEVKKYVDKLSDGQRKSYIDAFLESFSENNPFEKLGIKEETGVACFSEKNDSILMWGHYSGAHTGFYIEYDLIELSSKSEYKLTTERIV